MGALGGVDWEGVLLLRLPRSAQLWRLCVSLVTHLCQWSAHSTGVALVGLEGLGDVEGVLCGVIERNHDDNKQATSVFHLNMS